MTNVSKWDRKAESKKCCVCYKSKWTIKIQFSYFLSCNTFLLIITTKEQFSPINVLKKWLQQSKRDLVFNNCVPAAHEFILQRTHKLIKCIACDALECNCFNWVHFSERYLQLQHDVTQYWYIRKQKNSMWHNHHRITHPSLLTFTWKSFK